VEEPLFVDSPDEIWCGNLPTICFVKNIHLSEEFGVIAQDIQTGSGKKVQAEARFFTLMAATAIAVMFSAPVIYTFAADTPLLEPHSLIVDRSLRREQAEAQIIAARRYDTFWNNGDEALARAALAPNFVDNTLPAGRPQGVAGPLAASKLMRAAIPDMRCEIEQMIVAGDRVVAHLRFRGHFAGHFGQIQGQGQTINFIATDIYRVADERVAENWHIEDNLTLQQQLGVIPK
jgi:predicted ester cyclase